VTQDQTRKRLVDAIAAENALEAYTDAYGNEAGAALRQNIPQHMRVSVVLYVLIGELKDPLLRSVVTGDLFEAVRHAGETNVGTLSKLAKFFQTAAPAGCYGSRECVKSWRERFGIVEFNSNSANSARNGLQIPLH
jgi:hypothetical protein